MRNLCIFLSCLQINMITLCHAVLPRKLQKTPFWTVIHGLLHTLIHKMV
uniref:Ferredoxin-thioredoxin reductase catalytic chain n=1 Tax=Rhizophora mucronata TaxID=61149 RepID=A0A2P2JXN4_RHIMU